MNIMVKFIPATAVVIALFFSSCQKEYLLGIFVDHRLLLWLYREQSGFVPLLRLCTGESKCIVHQIYEKD